MEAVDLLGSIPLFSSLASDAHAELASRLVNRRYRRGETVFHKGDPGSTLFIIKNGKVKITALSPEGAELIITILAEGDFFGELSILDGAPRSASATAMEATQALALQRDDFLEVINGRPEVSAEILAILSHRLRDATQLLEDVVFLELPARLAKRLLDLAQRHGHDTSEGIRVDMRLTQYDLADAIGGRRESVNRLLGQFQDEGLLRIDRQGFLLVDADGLERRTH